MSDSQALPREIAPAIADGLRAKLRGPMLLPDAPGYDESRTLWNAMIDRRPGLIARCLGVGDVVAGVAAAREHGLPLSIKGGGHNIAGLALCDGGLLLDMSLMRGVWVDPARRSAQVQPGCLLGDVDRETQLHGLASVLGFISMTGCAGLTLGGGFGYLSRQYGWTSDTLLSANVVTADGRLVRASADENADLFWGLRGGGGNFGVVTNFEYQLYPVGPQIIAGAAAWPIAQAPEVLDLYRQTIASAPPELTVVAVLRLAPPAPWIAAEYHGKPIVALFYCHSGSLEDGARLAAPLKACGTPVGDIIQPRTYCSQQLLLDGTQPAGRRYYWKSEYLPSVEPELLTGALEHAAKLVSPFSAVVIFPIDGALNRLPAEHSAVGNRDARFVLNLTSSWANAADDAANIDWTRTAWQDLRRFSTGGTYLNFLNADDGDDRTRDALGASHARLVEIKTKWDPENLFRVNKNIAPATRIVSGRFPRRCP